MLQRNHDRPPSAPLEQKSATRRGFRRTLVGHDTPRHHLALESKTTALEMRDQLVAIEDMRVEVAPVALVAEALNDHVARDAANDRLAINEQPGTGCLSQPGGDRLPILDLVHRPVGHDDIVGACEAGIVGGHEHNAGLSSAARRQFVSISLT
ncbi:hypothetical protein, partial [Reyranella sp.]|uniref:hypothetical protein n=1 Tax=Reyranella sp. TaxID=1929291 RepID=UPI003D13ECF3